MGRHVRRLATIGATAAAAGGLLLSGGNALASSPEGATASSSVQAASCGWQGGQHYNHCGSTTIMLDVHHFFGSNDHYCASPGDNYINAGNSPYNTWVTTYAVYAGGSLHCAPGWHR